MLTYTFSKIVIHHTEQSEFFLLLFVFLCWLETQTIKYATYSVLPILPIFTSYWIFFFCFCRYGQKLFDNLHSEFTVALCTQSSKPFFIVKLLATLKLVFVVKGIRNANFARWQLAKCALSSLEEDFIVQRKSTLKPF